MQSLKSSHFKILSGALILSAVFWTQANAQVTSNFDNLPKASKHAKPAPKTHAYHAPKPVIRHSTDNNAFATTPLPPLTPPPLPRLAPEWMPDRLHDAVPPVAVTPSQAVQTPVTMIGKKGDFDICYKAGDGHMDTNAYDALIHLGGILRKDPALYVELHAYATGAADDPSLPRRMAFVRALDARSVLIAQNVPATRIYPQALGLETQPSQCPDRIEVRLAKDTLPGEKGDDITALVDPNTTATRH